METCWRDKIIFLVSGLFIGLGAAAFLVNFQYVMETSTQPSAEKPVVSLAHNESPFDFESIAERGGPLFKSSQWKNFERLRERFFEEPDKSPFFSRDEFDSLFQDSLAKFEDDNMKALFSISKEETSTHLLYEIKVDSRVDGNSVEVKVENNIVTITGKQQVDSRESDLFSSQNFFSSHSFSQSFSLPYGVDAENMEMNNRGEVIVLKFPKWRDQA